MSFESPSNTTWDEKTHSFQVNTGESYQYPTPPEDDPYLPIDQQAYSPFDQQVPPIDEVDADALASEQLLEENMAAILEKKNATVTDGRKFYITKGGKIRKQQKKYVPFCRQFS